MQNIKKETTVVSIAKQNKQSLEVDTQTLTALLSGLNQSLNYTNEIKNPVLTHLRNKRKYLINAFQDSYKELITTEVKIMNLSVAAESIKTRNDMIDGVYTSVMNEINHPVCR